MGGGRGEVPFLSCLVRKRNRKSSGAPVTYGRVTDWWRVMHSINWVVGLGWCTAQYDTMPTVPIRAVP